MSRAEGAASSQLILAQSAKEEWLMHLTTAAADQEVWYRVRGKQRRRPRVQLDHDGPEKPPRSSRPSEAAGSERGKAKAGRKGDHGGREGTGEGASEATPALDRVNLPEGW